LNDREKYNKHNNNSKHKAYRAVTNLPCKSWARPIEPRTVREIIGRPYLTNGLLLPHLLNALSVVAVPFAAPSLWTVVIIIGHRIQMLA